MNSATASSPTTSKSNHDAIVVETKEVNDGMVAYRIRCCDEEMTDSWHTVSVIASDLEQSLEDAKQRVAALHDAKVQWRQKNQK